jgi:hypothetical protein
MGFKESVEADIKGVFLDAGEFADLRTVIYDGERYADIPIVLSGLTEAERRPVSMGAGYRDSGQGLFMVSATLHCAASDLGGARPEKGQKIKVNGEEGGGGFFRTFKIATSTIEMGMVRLGLEAIDQ